MERVRLIVPKFPVLFHITGYKAKSARKVAGLFADGNNWRYWLETSLGYCASARERHTAGNLLPSLLIMCLRATCLACPESIQRARQRVRGLPGGSARRNLQFHFSDGEQLRDKPLKRERLRRFFSGGYDHTQPAQTLFSDVRSIPMVPSIICFSRV